jgi:hypothetical protein
MSQQTEFLDALDSLDVLVLLNAGGFSTIFSDSGASAKIEKFFGTKGVVSIHNSTSSRGDVWSLWDIEMHGARYLNFPSSERLATVHLDTIARHDPKWKALNRGLPDTARFMDEWSSFTTNGDIIRATPGLKVTVNIDESSYAGGMGGARVMGDHPMSWYREFSEGGRLFYTALGHRARSYTGPATTATTPEAGYFFRRQLYNAILWAAGVDSTGKVVSVAGRNRNAPARFADHARVTFNAGALTVSLLRDGPNTVEVLGVDGRRVALKRSEGRAEHRFDALRSGVYVVLVTSGGQRVTRMAVVE